MNRQLLYSNMKALIIIAIGLSIQACAGPALYSFKNDSNEILFYSPLSEKWKPDDKNKKIDIDKQTTVLFSPEFELSSEDGTRYIYNLPWSVQNREEFAVLFISKWDASDLLYVLIDEEYRLLIRDNNNSRAKEEQPIQLGFPNNPTIIRKTN